MLSQALIAEFTHEASNTRRMLEKVPAEQFSWRPHEKSMNLGHLASHVAHIPKWVSIILSGNEFDFTKEKFRRDDATTHEDLMQFFRESCDEAIKSMEPVSDEYLKEKWTFRAGEKIFFSIPRIAALRAMSHNHFIHHRGQLSVYLRLLNIPVPGMYGPSADEVMIS